MKSAVNIWFVRMCQITLLRHGVREASRASSYVRLQEIRTTLNAGNEVFTIADGQTERIATALSGVVDVSAV